MFGLNIDPSVARRELAFELAGIADQSGLDVVAIQDHPYHRQHLDTWTLLTYLAASTSRVHLMPNVTNLPLRTPAMVAKSAATLAILSDGRLELGVGAGGMWDAIHAYGGPRRAPSESVDAFEEAVAVIRQLWDPDGSGRLDGEHYHLDGARPGPLPDAPIPLWFGSYGPRMLALTGRHADGWSPSMPYAPPEAIPDMQRRIDAAAEEAGRDPGDIRRNYNLMGRIDPGAGQEDEERIVGGTKHWIETLVRFAEELRLDTFVFWPLGGDEADQARSFAHDVVPRVRERLGEATTQTGGYL